MRRAWIGRFGVAVGLTLFLAPVVEGAQCWILQSTGVAFGMYDVYSPTPLDSVGAIGILCNPGARTITVSLSSGNSGSFAQRFMRSAADTLNYNLYRDGARTEIWGDGTGGSLLYGPITITGWSWTSLSVFGRVTPGQDVAAGNYLDTVTVTVNF